MNNLKNILTNTRIVNFCERHPYFSAEQILLFFIDSMDKCVYEDAPSAMAHILTDFKNGLLQSVSVTQTAIGESMMGSVKDLCLALTRSIQNSNESMSEFIRLHAEINDSRMSDRMHDLNLKIQESTVLMTKTNAPTPLVNLPLIDKLNDSMETVVSQMSKVNAISSQLDALCGNFGQYLDKMKNPAARGHVTETKTKNILETAFPDSTVLQVPSKNQKGRMDIELIREGYPKILIDTKDYSSTVGKQEIEKFERDILMSNTHGILFSPFSGIYNKNNLQVTRLNNSLAVYICNTGMETGDLINAVKIIYDVDKFISTSTDLSIVEISTDTLMKVNILIQDQTSQIKEIKNHLNGALKYCDNLMLSEIKRLLGISNVTVTNEINATESQCKKCQKDFKNLTGLKLHLKKCNVVTVVESVGSVSVEII